MCVHTKVVHKTYKVTASYTIVSDYNHPMGKITSHEMGHLGMEDGVGIALFFHWKITKFIYSQLLLKLINSPVWSLTIPGLLLI